MHECECVQCSSGPNNGPIWHTGSVGNKNEHLVWQFVIFIWVVEDYNWFWFWGTPWGPDRKTSMSEFFLLSLPAFPIKRLRIKAVPTLIPRPSSPISQLSPVYPCSQTQCFPSSVCWHWPCKHCSPWHKPAGSPCKLHNAPRYPTSQSQRYVCASNATHTPFTHLG